MTASSTVLAQGGGAPPTSIVGTQAGPWWSRLNRRSAALVLAVATILILAAWQVAIDGFKLVNPVFLPPPLEIVEGFGQLAAREDILIHLGRSLSAWTIGFVLAIAVGVTGGVLLGASLPVERLAGPVVWTLYATPWLAYQPLSLVWFGFRQEPIIFLVFIASLFPVLLNTAAGVKAAEPSLLAASRVFGIGRVATYRRILLPSALPFVFVGMRQSAVMATISLIVAEMKGTSIGVGALISQLTAGYRTEQVFAVVVIAVGWTVGVGQLLKAVSRRVAPWQADARVG